MTAGGGGEEEEEERTQKQLNHALDYLSQPILITVQHASDSGSSSIYVTTGNTAGTGREMKWWESRQSAPLFSKLQTSVRRWCGKNFKMHSEKLWIYCWAIWRSWSFCRMLLTILWETETKEPFTGSDFAESVSEQINTHAYLCRKKRLEESMVT